MLTPSGGPPLVFEDTSSSRYRTPGPGRPGHPFLGLSPCRGSAVDRAEEPQKDPAVPMHKGQEKVEFAAPS